VWHLKKGDSLWPERFGDYELLKTTQGGSVFETQYQQNPIASEDTVVKTNMINLITPVEAYEILEEPDYIYASHDLAVKATDTSDFVGSVLAKQKGNKLVIIDCLEKKMGYVASKQYIKNLSVVHYGVIHLIEDKANGQQVIQELTGDVPGIVPINPGTASKSMRLETSTVPMESRNVFFLTDEFGLLPESLENLRIPKSSTPKNLAIPFGIVSQICSPVLIGKPAPPARLLYSSTSRTSSGSFTAFQAIIPRYGIRGFLIDSPSQNLLEFCCAIQNGEANLKNSAGPLRRLTV
jgi:phage terminase large subunit-like protein